MATKAEYIAKVLKDTMVEYMRVRGAQMSDQKVRQPKGELEVEIPNTGIKLQLHLNNKNEE
jgi:hypothetical protein